MSSITIKCIVQFATPWYLQSSYLKCIWTCVTVCLTTVMYFVNCFNAMLIKILTLLLCCALTVVFRHTISVTQCTMEVDRRICNGSFRDPSLSVDLKQRNSSNSSLQWLLHNSKLQLITHNLLWLHFPLLPAHQPLSHPIIRLLWVVALSYQMLDRWWLVTSRS